MRLPRIAFRPSWTHELKSIAGDIIPNLLRAAFGAACLVGLVFPDSLAAATDPGLLALQERSFVYGREYFVLRSGRAQMIVQADQVDLGPAVMYMLFDAGDTHQSSAKNKAFNFVKGQGLGSSATEVVLGGFPFTALGYETRTRWTTLEGIPAVEAVWWAGGVRVTEHILALDQSGQFLHRIALTSVNLGGPEDISLRLSLPAGSFATANGWLIRSNAQCQMALASASKVAARASIEQGALEIGPLHLVPGQTVSIDTMLLARIPSGQTAREGAAAAALPASPVPPETQGMPVVNLADSIAATGKTWAMTSSLRTTDATVQELFDKARFGLAGMVADAGVMDAGIFKYGTQWVRDSSNSMLGLVYAGHFELARRGLAHVLQSMVTEQGVTMIAGKFADPDLEQFDQMGELLHALRGYRDWTGDDSLIRENREKLLAMVERPLLPEFRDRTGMVHNRREFWERSFDDAHEISYQTYVILGLRDAASLAGPLGAEDRVSRWREEANRIQKAMLNTDGTGLIEDGHLIKRRNTNGQAARLIRFPVVTRPADVPMKTERANLADPDAATALPIALGLVPPGSALARNTLDELEKLRDGRWFGGGYERYHSSGECDTPGPWPFASCSSFAPSTRRRNSSAAAARSSGSIRSREAERAPGSRKSPSSDRRNRWSPSFLGPQPKSACSSSEISLASVSRKGRSRSSRPCTRIVLRFPQISGLGTAACASKFRAEDPLRLPW